MKLRFEQRMLSLLLGIFFSSPRQNPSVLQSRYTCYVHPRLAIAPTPLSHTLKSRCQATVYRHPRNVEMLSYGSFTHAILKELLNLLRIN